MILKRLDFHTALVDLVRLVSKKKPQQDEVVVAPRNRQGIVKNNEQPEGLLGIQQEQHITALEAINDAHQTESATNSNHMVDY